MRRHISVVLVAEDEHLHDRTGCADLKDRTVSVTDNAHNIYFTKTDEPRRQML